MGALRSILNARPALALLLILAALAVRALVPTGYMPGVEARGLTITLCSSVGETTQRVVIPVDGSSLPDSHDSATKDSPCAFGALSTASLGGADPVLLAVAIDHIISLGFAPATVPLLMERLHSRPPLRGPPAIS